MSEFRTEDVERGTELVSDIGGSKWELGDLANQVCPPSGNGQSDGGRLQRFAEAIDVSVASLSVYRAVSAAWPALTRVRASWTVHRELMANPDRFDIIVEQPFDQDGVTCDRWTLRGIRHRLERLPFDRSTPPRSSPPVEPPEVDPDELSPVRPPVKLPWDALAEGRRFNERLVGLRMEMESWYFRSPERDDRRAVIDSLQGTVADWQAMLDRMATETMEAAAWP